MEQHDLSCDVLVAGGGPAGVPCALAAARLGAKVILCQDRSVLGGNASSEIRMHIVGADCSGGRGAELATETREGGIIEEIRLDTAVQNPQRSASMLDLILYDKCRTESNLQLMLNTAIVGAKTQGKRITHAIARRESTEDHFTIAAKVFIDCTGDGRLGAEAEAPFRMGREGRDEFGESFAPERADDKTLGSSLLFMGRNMGHPVPFIPPRWARKFSEADLKHRSHGKPGADQSFEYGYWWLEWGGQLDTIKDNEAIRDELLAILLGVWDHIKNGGDHGADNWVLDWFGFVPGKRESRRFVGQYTLTQHDLQESRAFDDAIAYGGWPIDTHPPSGVDAPDQRPCTQHHLDCIYDIPLRACVSAGPRNFMFAGRNISATHVAFASTRVMATCAAMGQGVGTAAAHAVKNGIEPAELAGDPPSMTAIQQRLLRDDAYLIGAVNLDPKDCARDAKVSASSAQPNGGAANVISGPTRSTHGPKGVKPERAAQGLHRWMSDSAVGLPAWLQLHWEDPVPVAEVQLIFDTGMHRVLTLTHSDAYAARMKWGQPQPETVRDYTIEVNCNGKWETVAEIKNSYQRRRVHKVKPSAPVSALRINVTATNGLNHARIFEVRVY
ncbi:MAG: FAD-dependent oxidoreductase [Candidatus Hydrogenedentota bacterium]